jgi:hypothetical protein
MLVFEEVAKTGRVPFKILRDDGRPDIRRPWQGLRLLLLILGKDQPGDWLLWALLFQAPLNRSSWPRAVAHRRHFQVC